jgi:hypothetical protein
VAVDDVFLAELVHHRLGDLVTGRPQMSTTLL